MKNYNIYLIFTLLSFNVCAESVSELPPMVITTSNISNYNHDDLKNFELPDLNGVLRQEPSVTINQGSGQMASDLSFRGARGQGMLTLDGVPLFSDFVGVYSLQRYSINELESVKLSRSFDGNFSGSRTLGGTIHLKTRQLQENDNFLHFEGGSYDTLRESAGAGLTSELGNFSAVVGRSDIFNGVSESKFGSERDQYEMNHASGKWSKNFDKGKLDASLYFVKSRQDIDGPGLLPDKKSFGWADDTLGKLSDETWVAQLRGQYDLAANWNTALQFGFTQDQQKLKYTIIEPFSITNQLLMADWKNTHQFALSKSVNSSIVWGINTQHQQALNMPSSSQTTISPNVHGELLLENWKFDADTRFDHSDVYGNHQVFSLGANRSLSETTSVWAKGGTGYRQPGVSELMHLSGNKNLQGESSTGGEMGVRWKPFFDSEISVNGYYQNYKNMILFLFDPTVGTVRAGNLPETDVFGVEFQSQHRWSDFWKSGLNYGYMSAKTVKNLYVPSLPEHQGVFWNELQLLKPLKMRVDLTFHDAYFFDGSNTRRAEAAPRINALLKYQLTPKTDLYLRGENIANNRTTEIHDFTVNGAAVYFGLQTGF